MAWNFYRAGRRLRKPITWPIALRRVFLVSLPIALPVWLISLLIMVAMGALKRIIAPFATFWNAPPKRLRNERYEYTPHSSRTGEVVRLKDARRDRDAA